MSEGTRSNDARVALARRRLGRWRRRRQSRGATIFLVTLVAVLLTAMGVFAARATSLSGRASGYLRQSEQSHFLMQHALSLSLTAIDANRSEYSRLDSPVWGTNCLSSSAYPSNQTIRCAKFTSSWAGDSFLGPVNQAQQQAGALKVPPVTLPPEQQQDPGLNTPGSLGPALLLPAMYVEMTDLANMARPLAGTASSGLGSEFKFRLATLVVAAQVGPSPPNGPTAACTDASEQGTMTVVSREMGRGQIMIGP